MKKLSLLFLLPILFFSCSSNDNEPKQDYTSFVFVQTIDNRLGNCIVAYLDESDHYIKIANLGTLESKNQHSTEIAIENESINEIYLFIGSNIKSRLEDVYKLKKNKKNVFKIREDVKGLEVFDDTDPTQYPQ